MEILRGVLQAWDAANHKATVQIQGSRSQWLADVPTSRGIPSGEMVTGRVVAVLFFQQNDPTDAMVIGVF